MGSNAHRAIGILRTGDEGEFSLGFYQRQGHVPGDDGGSSLVNLMAEYGIHPAFSIVEEPPIGQGVFGAQSLSSGEGGRNPLPQYACCNFVQFVPQQGGIVIQSFDVIPVG